MESSKRCRDDELLQTMCNELRGLRRSVREAGEGFMLRKEGEIESLLAYLLDLPPQKLENFGRSWLRQSRELCIKPAKGRIKDLRRIDALLEDLLNCVIEVDAPHDERRAPPQRPPLHLELIHEQAKGSVDPP